MTNEKQGIAHSCLSDYYVAIFADKKTVSYFILFLLVAELSQAKQPQSKPKQQDHGEAVSPGPIRQSISKALLGRDCKLSTPDRLRT